MLEDLFERVPVDAVFAAARAFAQAVDQYATANLGLARIFHAKCQECSCAVAQLLLGYVVVTITILPEADHRYDRL